MAIKSCPTHVKALMNLSHLLCSHPDRKSNPPRYAKEAISLLQRAALSVARKPKQSMSYAFRIRVIQKYITFLVVKAEICASQENLDSSKKTYLEGLTLFRSHFRLVLKYTAFLGKHFNDATEMDGVYHQVLGPVLQAFYATTHRDNNHTNHNNNEIGTLQATTKPQTLTSLLESSFADSFSFRDLVVSYAQFLYQNGRVKLAQEYYRMITQLCPMDTKSLCAMAEFCWKVLKNNREAEMFYKRSTDSKVAAQMYANERHDNKNINNTKSYFRRLTSNRTSKSKSDELQALKSYSQFLMSTGHTHTHNRVVVKELQSRYRRMSTRIQIHNCSRIRQGLTCVCTNSALKSFAKLCVQRVPVNSPTIPALIRRKSDSMPPALVLSPSAPLTQPLPTQPRRRSRRMADRSRARERRRYENQSDNNSPRHTHTHEAKQRKKKNKKNKKNRPIPLVHNLQEFPSLPSVATPKKGKAPKFKRRRSSNGSRGNISVTGKMKSGKMWRQIVGKLRNRRND